MSFLWNLFQQQQIYAGHSSANKAQLESKINSGEIAKLEERINTLALANQAMWELISNVHGYTEKDLLKKMDEIDLRDGVADGKYAPAPLTQCPDCNHPIKRKRSNCYWCGANLNLGGPFSSR